MGSNLSLIEVWFINECLVHDTAIGALDTINQTHSRGYYCHSPWADWAAQVTVARATVAPWLSSLVPNWKQRGSRTSLNSRSLGS